MALARPAGGDAKVAVERLVPIKRVVHRADGVDDHVPQLAVRRQQHRFDRILAIHLSVALGDLRDRRHAAAQRHDNTQVQVRIVVTHQHHRLFVGEFAFEERKEPRRRRGAIPFAGRHGAVNRRGFGHAGHNKVRRLDVLPRRSRRPQQRQADQSVAHLSPETIFFTGCFALKPRRTSHLAIVPCEGG